MVRIAMTLLALLVALGGMGSTPILAAPPQQAGNCLFFTETGSGQGGFPVCDDAQARFRTAFGNWGLQRIGYPISQRYLRDGFVTQAFQKAIMQWRADTSQVVLVNVFDDLHNDGFDERLLATRQTPRQFPPGWDNSTDFATIVRQRQALLDRRPALRRAYFASAEPLTFFGLPTSEVTDMGNHYAIRLQRAVLQEWKETVPWARAGEVTIANGGDIAKELGGLPQAALAPVASAAAAPPPVAGAPSSPPASPPPAPPPPPPAPPTPAPPPPAPPPPGSSANPYGLVLRANPTQYRGVIQESGARWVRTSIAWRSVEPDNRTPDRYDWRFADGELGALAATGAEPIVMIWENPTWAASTTCGPIDRVGLGEFGEFFGAVVERYDGDGDRDAPGSPVARVFQFYNEPDWQIEEQTWLGGCWGRHGAAYAELLATAHAAGHAASPATVIMLGAIGGEDVGVEPTSGRPYFNFNLNGGDFVDDVLRASAGRQTFDALGMHSFPAFSSRWTRWGPDVLGKVTYYRQRLAGAGRTVPIYITEIGRRSDPGQVIAGEAGSPEVQAAYVVKALARGKAAGVTAMTWFSLLDEPTLKWGLLTQEGTPKPSLRAYQVGVSQLGAATYAEPLNAGGAEGYWFQRADGRRMLVAWSNGGAAGVSLPGAQLEIVAVDGGSRSAADGGPGDEDGSANGQVRLTLSPTPLFLIVR